MLELWGGISLGLLFGFIFVCINFGFTGFAQYVLALFIVSFVIFLAALTSFLYFRRQRKISQSKQEQQQLEKENNTSYIITPEKWHSIVQKITSKSSEIPIESVEFRPYFYE